MVEVPPDVMRVNAGLLLGIFPLWIFVQHFPDASLSLHDWRTWGPSALFAVVALALAYPASSNIPTCAVLIGLYCLYEWLVPPQTVWMTYHKLETAPYEG